jgi:DNA-binding NarL/FixJ family response regulator
VDLRPEVVLLNLDLPLVNGLDAARQLKRIMPDVKIVFLTVNEDPGLAAEAFRAGASSCLLKGFAASELRHAIEEALDGRTYVTPQAAHALDDDGAQPARKQETLSARKREVLRLIAQGHTMKETARIMRITPRTVAFHKYSLMRQLGIKSSAELVRFAVKQHLLSE